MGFNLNIRGVPSFNIKYWPYPTKLPGHRWPPSCSVWRPAFLAQRPAFQFLHLCILGFNCRRPGSNRCRLGLRSVASRASPHCCRGLPLCRKLHFPGGLGVGGPRAPRPPPVAREGRVCRAVRQVPWCPCSPPRCSGPSFLLGGGPSVLLGGGPIVHTGAPPVLLSRVGLSIPGFRHFPAAR